MGEYQCNIRGRKVDFEQTMINFARENEDIVEYLYRIGMKKWDLKNQKLLGMETPNINGLVILLECDEEEESMFMFLATGMWDRQNYVYKELEKKDLDSICKFFDPKHIETEITSGLDKNFVIIEPNKPQKIYSVECELCSIYYY